LHGLAHVCPMKLGLDQASPLLRWHKRVSTPCPFLYIALGIKLASQCLCTLWTNSQACPTNLNCLPTASNSFVSDERNDPRVQCNWPNKPLMGQPSTNNVEATQKHILASSIFGKKMKNSGQRTRLVEHKTTLLMRNAKCTFFLTRTSFAVCVCC